MTKEEAIKILQNIYFEVPEIKEALQIAIEALSRPSLQSNLDEAADKFAVFYDQGTCDGIAQDCFKAGAEWMAEQGKSIVLKIGLTAKKICCMISEKTLDFLGVQVDDEIVIQVRKK